jgi:hypothetical protein
MFHARLALATSHTCRVQACQRLPQEGLRGVGPARDGAALAVSSALSPTLPHLARGPLQLSEHRLGQEVGCRPCGEGEVCTTTAATMATLARLHGLGPTCAVGRHRKCPANIAHDVDGSLKESLSAQLWFRIPSRVSPQAAYLQSEPWPERAHFHAEVIQSSTAATADCHV